MSYKVRDDKGVLLMEMTNLVAQRVINSCQGFFRKRKTTEGVEQTCYEITEDSLFGTSEFKVFFWKGTVLIPDVDLK